VRQRLPSIAALLFAAGAVAVGINMRVDRIRDAEPRSEETSPDGRGAEEAPTPALPPVPELEGHRPPERSMDLPPHLRDPSVAREDALLREARARLADDPAAALRRAEAHRRRHPRGRLSETREVLAVEALLALGRHDEAERRFYAYRERYPQSRDRDRLESALSSSAAAP
jgi:hypothetical protein